MLPTTLSGEQYNGTQSYQGKWSGTGFPEETLKYFEYYFKGKQADSTGYMPNELLFETLATNSPDLKVLDVERHRAAPNHRCRCDGYRHQNTVFVRREWRGERGRAGTCTRPSARKKPKPTIAAVMLFVVVSPKRSAK